MTPTTFRIGGDPTVRRLGFGAMHLPTEPGPARETSLAVARRAVENLAAERLRLPSALRDRLDRLAAPE